MKSLRSRSHRRVEAAVLAAVLALGIVNVPAVATAAEESAVTEIAEGSLTWGVRYSIRNYLENFGHTEGWVAAYDGASYARGDSGAVFPLESGWVDAEAGTASLRFRGAFEMFGFGETWLYFDNVRVEVAGGSAEIIVDLIESYSVKTSRDDFVLATYALDAADLVSDEDAAVRWQTGAGNFSESAAIEHLPHYGGPTYAAPNDYTDPLVLSLRADAGDDDTTPGTPPDDDDDADADGPYGTSAGTPLSDTAAFIRVTPGYAVNAEGATLLTLEGFGFDPGPAVAPGAGTGGIYVGFGTMKDPSDPEAWRRSKGGSSGPQGLADYTYGSPIFVANQGSGDADVADGVMNADGSWRATVTVPGSSVASFFGDTIDCLAVQCGFFSFGAHGVIRAANEAFTPVFFTGQDESTWPDRDDDDPVVVPPVTPDRPGAAPSALPAESTLVAGNRGAVDVLAVQDGVATVFVGADTVDTWVGAVVYSEPQFVDWYLVPASARIQVTLPEGLEPVEHRLAVLGAEDELIGWDSFALAGGGDDDDTVKGEPYGSSTGTNAHTGATLTVTPAWSLADAGQVVTLKGAGYATSNNGSSLGGAYVLFGWIDPDAGGDWGPGPSDQKQSLGRSGITYTYADDGVPAGTFQTMVNYPGNVTEPGLPYIQADGSWEIQEFPIRSSRFTSAHGIEIDCYVQQCGILTIGAHGSANAGVEVFAPVYFTDDRPANTPPGVGSGGLVDNPNLVGSGLSAATGLDGLVPAGDARTVLIAGFLLISIGLFAGSLLFTTIRRRPVGAPA